MAGLGSKEYPPGHGGECTQLQELSTIAEKGVDLISVMCVHNPQEELAGETAHTAEVGP